jgi:hypothetical protein
VDAGIVSFGRLSFFDPAAIAMPGGAVFGEDPVTTSAGSRGNTNSHRFEGDASTLKLACLRFEVYHGEDGCGAYVIEGIGEIVGTGEKLPQGSPVWCTIVHRKMSFEWDPRKAAANVGKHGVRFADSVSVLEDDRALTVVDESSEEPRWVTIGLDSMGRVLVVVYAWRGDRVRIISARPAAARERRQYEEGA